MDVDGSNQGLDSHLDNLVEAAKIPAKSRGSPIKPTVEATTSLSYDRGLLPAELARIVDLVTVPSHLDQASLGALVRHLYPASIVDDDVVLTIVGSLGHGQLKPSLTIQSLLLRWLVMVYHVLESHTILSRCYSVLFNLLDTAAIRPQLCHLLALVTRRKHVRPFRIQSILDLSRQTGHDPSLVGLLRVFKNYYPEVIVGHATRGKASPFKYPDTEWRERLDEVQAAYRLQQDRNQGLDGPRNGFRVNHRLNHRKGSILPSVQTSHAHEDSVTLEEIDSADQFIKNLEKIELPNQLVAVLADPLLQKLLLLRPSQHADARISDWLDACIADAAEEAYVDGGTALLDLLELVHDHAIQTKTLHPVFDPLLDKIYPVWNGKDRRDVVLGTLTHLPYKPFEELYNTHLGPLEAKVLDDTAEPLLALLGFYTSLVQNWTRWLLAEPEEATPVEAPDAVAALTEHVNRLCLTLLQTVPTTACHVSILEFYHRMTFLFCEPKSMNRVRVVAPSPATIYTIAFSDSPAVFSAVCSVLARYKRGLEVRLPGGTGASQPQRQLQKREREQLAVFNSFFVDICNCVWRGLAFDRASGSMGMSVAARVTTALQDWAAEQERGDRDALRQSLGLSRSPALCLLSAAFFRGLEDVELADGEGEDGQPPLLVRHAGPVSQNSLRRLARDGGLSVSWQDFRLGLLNELEDGGFGGVKDLMFQSMRSVANGAREKASQGGDARVA